MNLILIKNLTKKYKETIALDDISLDIRKGEIFGLLGPNGAGKTTLISILSTILLPTKGKVSIGDYDLNKNPEKIRQIIGLVFQESILDDELTAFDNLDIHARLYNIPKKIRVDKINELLRLVNLDKVAHQKISTFSGGMKRKIELVRGLISDPEILFLDEPTLGLDPRSRRDIWNYILKLKNENNLTIILSTHYMEEADNLCDRVGIIQKGKFVRIDTPDKLKGSLKGDIIEIKVNKLNENILNAIKKLKYVKDADILPGHFRVYVSDGEKTIQKLIIFLNSKKIKINSITLKKPTLEDVFLHFTGEELS